MEKVLAFKTKNGKLFENPEDAKVHEMYENLESKVKNMGLLPETTLKSMLSNKEEIRAFLKWFSILKQGGLDWVVDNRFEIKQVFDESEVSNKEKTLPNILATACFYAQDHVRDFGASSDELEIYFETVSHMIACFLCNYTNEGRGGVESFVILYDLSKMPPKSVKEWEYILNKHAESLGGWKTNF